MHVGFQVLVRSRREWISPESTLCARRFRPEGWGITQDLRGCSSREMSMPACRCRITLFLQELGAQILFFPLRDTPDDHSRGAIENPAADEIVQRIHPDDGTSGRGRRLRNVDTQRSLHATVHRHAGTGLDSQRMRAGVAGSWPRLFIASMGAVNAPGSGPCGSGRLRYRPGNRRLPESFAVRR